MAKTNEYREALAVPIYELSINAIVQDICLHPKYFEDIYQLTINEEQTVSWRAIWVCEKLSELHPEWFDQTIYHEFIRRLIACTHNGSKRLYISVLYNLPVPASIPVDLLNFCLDHMLSPQESIGVQALSIKMAYLLCRNEPELLQELKLILENTEVDFYSKGVQTTIRNVLKSIRGAKRKQ